MGSQIVDIFLKLYKYIIKLHDWAGLFGGLFIVRYHFINSHNSRWSERIIAGILNGTSLFDAQLQCLQQTVEHIIVGNFFSEQQSLHGIVISEQCDHILKQEAITVFG